MERLYEFMERQLDGLTADYRRYMHERIDWTSRMLGLVGPRGVGKTTLFLQHLRDSPHRECSLYVTADSLYFTDRSLYETAESFNKAGGRYLYVDEIHKYANWAQELKAAYDSFPDLSIYFTGSSILDITRGAYDLSRRSLQYSMQGLSFREWLGMRHGIVFDALTLADVLGNKARIPGVRHPLPLFKDYLACGYYPFGDDVGFPLRLNQVVSRAIEVDIPQFTDMRPPTSRKLKRLLAVIGGMAPFKPNMTKLASQIGTSRSSLETYLEYLEKAGLVVRLAAPGTGLASIGKVEKVYVDNPNIAYALCDAPDKGTLRETFFFNQLRVDYVVVASPLADFAVEDITFEVGGKSKGFDQLKGAQRGIVVRDDIEFGHGSVVPLWAFGLLY